MPVAADVIATGAMVSCLPWPATTQHEVMLCRGPELHFAKARRYSTGCQGAGVNA